MFEVLPTQCLHWLNQVILALESQADVADLEQGLWRWANHLLPQLESLYAGEWDQHPEAANWLGEYCEGCLELCDGILQQDQQLDGQQVADWKSQLNQAAEAFLQAEQALTEKGGLTCLMA